MSKRSIVKGTLILTIAGILTKCLGFYNRIFLTRIIGVKELGVYQLIFPLYMLAFSFCCQGISTALTKQVSYHIGQKSPENAKKILWYSILVSASLGTAVSIGIYGLAKPISLYLLKNSACAPLLQIITVAIPFICIKTCINAYFVGVDKPGYHGFSHLIEQVIRIGAAYLLAYLMTENMLDARLAIIAMAIGEISATLLSLLFYWMYQRSSKSEKKESDSAKVLLEHLAKDAVPITTNNLMLTLFSSLEAILMPAMLYRYYMDGDTSMEIYGIVTGIVIPFLLFPSTITTSLSTMLLPAVSYANARKDKRTIHAALKNSIIFCLVLGVAAWIAYIFFGELACRVAFHSEDAGVLLRQMSFLCPLIYISGTLASILNGIDKAFQNLMYHIVSIVIRILFIVLLVPNYGLTAFVGGMTVSYVVLNLLMLLSVSEKKEETT